MENLKIEITPDDFDKLPSTDKKLDVIYNALVVQQKRCKTVIRGNHSRFRKLEKRRLKDSGLAAAFGGVMGFLAGLVKGY